MRWALVAVVACSAPAPVSQTPRVVEPTGPELVTSAPGATAFAIDGSDVYWLAPGSGVWRSGTKLADADDHARGIVIVRDGSATAPYWIHGDGTATYMGGSAGEAPLALANTKDGIVFAYPDRVVYSSEDLGAGFVLDGSDPVVAGGNDPVVGTSTTLYQRKAATPVAGGVRALAVDGDDIFFGNTSIFEKYGHGPISKLGPAGGPVTAMAVDPEYVYWAIGSGDRDPAIYRAKRKKPELELFTRVGSASQLIVAGDFLYWLDPAEGAVHRIRRQK
jgi:hypothetical protein